MGLFDRLSKEGRAKSALDRAVKKAGDKQAQSADRFAAMEKLRDDGSDEALYGLARRFSFTYDKGIDDEQEKEWAVEALTAAGERAVPAIHRFVLESETISHGMKVLERVAARDKILGIVDEILAREEPGYTRDPQRKIQILTFLSEWTAGGAADVSKRVAPYLADFDENVKFTAIETIAHQPDPSARVALLEALVRPEEESRRIKMRIADVLAQVEWQVTERKEQVSKLLATDLNEFGMHHDKLVRKSK